jgi:hypothetical protein
VKRRQKRKRFYVDAWFMTQRTDENPMTLSGKPNDWAVLDRAKESGCVGDHDWQWFTLAVFRSKKDAQDYARRLNRTTR